MVTKADSPKKLTLKFRGRKISPTDIGIFSTNGHCRLKARAGSAGAILTLELEAPEEAKVKLARPPHPDFGSDSIYLI